MRRILTVAAGLVALAAVAGPLAASAEADLVLTFQAPESIEGLTGPALDLNLCPAPSPIFQPVDPCQPMLVINVDATFIGSPETFPPSPITPGTLIFD